MANGYTNCIENGASFEEFVWRCARAMAANYGMRDLDWNAPIVDYRPSSYHLEEAESGKAMLVLLKKMSVAEAQIEASKEYDQEVKAQAAKKTENKDAKLKAAYEAMLARVNAWEPPTSDHAGFKDFMKHQLKESIKFDSPLLSDPAPVCLTGEQWLSERLADTEASIEYHARKYSEEVVQVLRNNEWNRQLRASVPQPILR